MPASANDLALLLRAATPAEAAMARGLLEAEGIPCLVDGRGLGDVAHYELHRVANQRTPDVWVSRDHEARARALLAAAWGAVPEPAAGRAAGVPARVSAAFLVTCLLGLLGILVWISR